MARYSIKMLKDENGNPFVPLVNTEGIKNNDGESLDSILSRKLETSNIKAGSNITINEDNGNITINSTGGGGGGSTTLIDNLTTSDPNQGALDARQGKVLKDSIPQVINNVTTVDTNKALSAYQGYLLDHKFNDYLPLNKLANNLTTSVDKVGQYALDAYQGKVLKVSIDSLSKKIDSVEDNQIISSDKSINDIVTLTKEEYKQLIDDDSINETTYYNILDDVIPASTSTPLGGIIFWPAALGQLQSNFMRLQGQTLNIADYPSLFKILGTTYGGDGETTFKLPDASGLTMVGISDSDDTFSTLGNVIGEKTHTLKTNEIPYHEHFYKNNSGGQVLPAIDQGKSTTWGASFSESGDYKVAPSVGQLQTSPNGQPHNNIQPSLLGYWVMKVKEDLYTENLTSLDMIVKELKEKFTPVILFDGGEDGALENFKLTDSWLNYSYIEVFYTRAEYEIASTKAPTDLHKDSVLPIHTSCSFYGYGGGFWTGWKQLDFSVTKPLEVTVHWGNGYTVGDNQPMQTDTQNTIKILRVLGYK